MPTTRPSPLPITGNIIIDVTTSGWKWYFAANEPRIIHWSVAGTKWSWPELQTAQIQANFKAAFQNIAEFIDVQFDFLGYYSGSGNTSGFESAAKAGSEINISYAWRGTSTNGIYADDARFNLDAQTAFAYFPQNSISPPYPGAEGDIWLNYNNPFIRSLTFSPGTNGFALLIHEILHSLGLKHPHDSGGTGRPTYQQYGITTLDRQWVSVMSYDRHETGGDGAYTGSQPISPMLWDAIALQYLYGESKFNLEDTNYDLSRYLGLYYNCQWDAGGVDILDASNLKFGVVIDLQDNTVFNGTRNVYAGYVTSRADLLSLAATGQNPTYFTWLLGDYENAKGSAFSDVISGNGLKNYLDGGGGNDRLIGGDGDDYFDWDPSYREGADTFEGGQGNDVFVLSGPNDVVVELPSQGIDTVYAGFDYSLVGTNIENLWSFSNQISPLKFNGNSFSNLIGGGLGPDTLSGAEGDDTISGLDGNDSLIGGLGRDSLAGAAGNDTLDGGIGVDTLVGGPGNDTYVVSDPSDLILELSEQGVDEVQTSLLAYVLGPNLENCTALGGENISIDGNTLNNLLTGNPGNNTIYGGGGNDTMLGGDGNDLLIIGAGKSLILGGGGVDILRLPFTRTGITDAGFFGADGVILRAPGAEAMFSNVEFLQFTDGTITYSDFLAQQKKTSIITSTGNPFDLALLSTYKGPVNYLQYEHISNSTNATIYGTKASEFLKASGGGSKAINGGGGNDVIDGGIGSNFLTGGGTSQDKVTFYLDGRASGESWSTITDFKLSNDFITIWGWRPGVSGIKVDEAGFNNAGAKGYEGLTIRFLNLLPDAAPSNSLNPFTNSITLTGYSLEQLGVKTLQELSAQISAGLSRFVRSGTIEGQGYLQIGQFIQATPTGLARDKTAFSTENVDLTAPALTGNGSRTQSTPDPNAELEVSWIGVKDADLSHSCSW